jgi:hypothetical protein
MSETYPRPADPKQIFKNFNISNFSKEEIEKVSEYISTISNAYLDEGRAVMLLDPNDKLTPLIILHAAQTFGSMASAPETVAFNNQLRIVIG